MLSSLPCRLPFVSSSQHQNHVINLKILSLIFVVLLSSSTGAVQLISDEMRWSNKILKKILFYFSIYLVTIEDVSMNKTTTFLELLLDWVLVFFCFVAELGSPWKSLECFLVNRQCSRKRVCYFKTKFRFTIYANRCVASHCEVLRELWTRCKGVGTLQHNATH